jgi:hypothetical protein
MPKATFFCDDNFNQIKAAIHEICSDLNRDGFENGIRINTILLQECFEAARGSVKFYNLDDNEISHYKEISHIAFWIVRLKPIRVINPFNVIDAMTSMGIDLTESITGLKTRTESIRKGIEYPINEHVAFFLAKTQIRACQLGEIEALPVGARSSYTDRFTLIDEKVDTMIKSIMLSMRYHTFSARGFALMMESLMRTGEI